MHKVSWTMGGLLLGSMALAQGDTLPTDIATWFSSSAALAAVVATLVALVRKHLLKSLEGVAVVGFSLVLGVALAYLGKLLGYLGNDWPVFGLSAGLIASGGTDFLKGLINSNAKAAAVDPRVDAGRDRLR